MTREKTTKEIRLEEVGQKRDELIMKVIGNIYKGRINNLFWNNKGEFMISERIRDKNWHHPPQSINEVYRVMMSNISSIADVFNEKCPEHLDMLEFLLEKINEGWAHQTEQEIEEDIKKIKERCGTILMILSIEAGN